MIEQVILEQPMIFEELLYTVLAMPIFYVIMLACAGIVALSFKLDIDPNILTIRLAKVGVYLVKFTAYHTGAFIIDTGSHILNRYSDTAPAFSFPSPVMVHASTGPRGYRNDAQNGFTQQREQGGGDDDGDADGDYAHSVERNGSPQQARKISWKDVFEAIDKFREDLNALKEAAP